MVDRSEHGLHRRVTGHHDMRMDGISDLLCRANGTSVLDVGCNRGMAGYEFHCNGSTTVHGIDNHPDSIHVARSIFADVRNCSHRFEVGDLTEPGILKKIFGTNQYDIILLLAITHKVRRAMPTGDLTALLDDLARRAIRYIGWRGFDEELEELDRIFSGRGLERIQYSTISESICPAAIWRRK